MKDRCQHLTTVCKMKQGKRDSNPHDRDTAIV